MRRILPRFVLLALSLAGSIALAAPSMATSCGDLINIAPAGATITSATDFSKDAHRILEWSLITCGFALAIIVTVYGMK